MFALIALQLVSDPEQRTENGGAVASQIANPSFDFTD